MSTRNVLGVHIRPIHQGDAPRLADTHEQAWRLVHSLSAPPGPS
jgi:hypothetical protein